MGLQLPNVSADRPTPPTASSPTNARAQAALITVGIALGALYAYAGRREHLLYPVWIFFCLYGTGYVLYLYAGLRLAPRLRAPSRFNVSFIFATGAVYRIALLFAKPSLSTDIYRYLWDGSLPWHGINPFQWAPWNPKLAALRDYAVYWPMEYKPYQTVYMSVSQAVFAANHLIFGASITGYKCVYLLFDLGIMGILTLLLRRLSLPTTNVIWYAWCPLPIFEIALAGHQDVVGVFLILLTFVTFSPKRWGGAAITLAASVLTKGFSVLLIPLFMRLSSWRFGLLAGMMLVLFGLPQILALHAFLHGMKQYLNNVQVNGSLHALADTLLWYVTPRHDQIASDLGDTAIIGLVIWAVRTPIDSLQELIRRAIAVLGGCLLVVPTLFAWYLVWILPLAACLGRRPPVSILLLTGTVLFSYTFYVERTVYPWAAWVEYLPFYAVLIWELRRGVWSVRTLASEESRLAERAPDQVPPPAPVVVVGTSAE